MAFLDWINWWVHFLIPMGSIHCSLSLSIQPEFTEHAFCASLLGCYLSLSCVWLWDSMDCSPPGSSIPGISQARVLEWVAIFFSRGSSQPTDWIGVSCTAGRFFITEPPGRHNIGWLIKRKRNQQNPLDPAFMKLTVMWGSSLFIKESQWRVY